VIVELERETIGRDGDTDLLRSVHLAVVRFKRFYVRKELEGGIAGVVGYDEKPRVAQAQGTQKLSSG
jgi:hypothetical protein